MSTWSSKLDVCMNSISDTCESTIWYGESLTKSPTYSPNEGYHESSTEPYVKSQNIHCATYGHYTWGSPLITRFSRISAHIFFFIFCAPLLFQCLCVIFHAAPILLSKYGYIVFVKCSCLIIYKIGSSNPP